MLSASTIFAFKIPINRIIGGHSAIIEDFPYQAALFRYNHLYCGAVIIHTKYLLTAAHCTFGLNPKSLSVRVGASHRNKLTKILLHDCINHPDYNDGNVVNDISLLILKNELKFNKQVAAIALPQLNEKLPEGTLVTISGWGSNGTKIEQKELQYVNVPIVDTKICKEAYSGYANIEESMLCAGFLNTGGKDSCQGDSGGPLVTNGKLYGVVSWGHGCAKPYYPGVYTNVSHFRDWIDDTITNYAKIVKVQVK